jgi:ATP-dependent DNA ligase
MFNGSQCGPLSPGSRLDADYPENGVLIPRRFTVKDPTGVAALYLGKKEGKELVYMGKVGTGWSRTVSSQIREQLDTVVSPKSKLTKQVNCKICLGLGLVCENHSGKA